MVLQGAAQVEGDRLVPGTLLYLGSGRECIDVRCNGAAKLLLVGGVPFAEEIVLWWNFVARSHAEIGEAVADWNAGRSEERRGGKGWVSKCRYRWWPCH